MPAKAGCPSAAQPPAVIELRLLMELAAARELADRGPADQEFAVMRRLADATIRSARRRDLPGYLQADMAFHMYLLGLTGDPDLPRVARPLLSRSLEHELSGEHADRLLAVRAGEHAWLIDLLADDVVTAAEDLLRRHIAAPLPAPASVGQVRSVKTRI